MRHTRHHLSRVHLDSCFAAIGFKGWIEFLHLKFTAFKARPGSRGGGIRGNEVDRVSFEAEFGFVFPDGMKRGAEDDAPEIE
jgi:hypothetical protein